MPSVPQAFQLFLGQSNVLLWGILGVQKEAALAAKRCIVTVEEIVDELDAPMNACVLPSWALTAVCHVPGGAHPSYIVAGLAAASAITILNREPPFVRRQLQDRRVDRVLAVESRGFILGGAVARELGVGFVAVFGALGPFS